MISKSTLLHLRIPFSFFLMPVFLFALGISINPSGYRIVLTFIVLHLFIYPASNAYNSYFDKDEESIGGLKHPPAVERDLYATSLVFDGAGILLALCISRQFAVMVFIYGLISKAYSHPSIRIKKYPWLSWLIAGFFQGLFTFWMCYMALNHRGFDVILQADIFIPAVLTTLILMGFYPLTQIYQHKEDKKRGDLTLSCLLGIRGTFVFSAAVFLIALPGFLVYFKWYFGWQLFYLFLLSIIPVLAFFSRWFLKAINNPAKADYSHTMRLSMISSLSLSTFFILLYFVK
ncbi:UbiA prenyltransferase [Desulfosudis oleivorans Hxd3]|uniref:UbiA prenyltransferase n=1 Tax=Desulfosudis oleivorans (strain DSM 6200 / JCM 39069 / Hxd3) TaxID=96561 RepID=A8ZTW8_DESOH|nr:UbiA prenyltransferase [Desulfosudis oleivorans Hxd3]